MRTHYRNIKEFTVRGKIYKTKYMPYFIYDWRTNEIIGKYIGNIDGLSARDRAKLSVEVIKQGNNDYDNVILLPYIAKIINKKFELALLRYTYRYNVK